jgi:glycosyltransferase involved in cell wall biosynthesis
MNNLVFLAGIVRKTDDIEFPEDDGITAFIPMPPYNGRLLPVYNYNPYEGYDSKRITDMTTEEGEEHIQFVSKRLADLIQAHHYDFILTNHCIFSPVNVKRALDICGEHIPYCSKIHGSALNCVAAKDTRWLPMIYEGLRGASKLICGTNYMKTRLFEVLTDELPCVDVIGCGVNTALFSGFDRVNLTDRPFRMIFFSHILHSKGIGELLLAMPHVKAMHPDVEFHVMGTGTYVENFNAMVEALNEGDVIKFESNAFKDDFVAEHVDVRSLFKPIDTDGFIHYHGFVTHDFLAPFLASCDVMLAPSKADEAFGLVTVEAMAAGVYPVVADHSGLSNVVDLVSSFDSAVTKHMRIPFPAGRIDVDELIKAVSAAVEFVKSDNTIGDKLKEIAKNFDWKHVCEQILS